MKVLIVFNHPAPYKVRMFNELAKLVDLTVIFERTKAKNRPQSFYNCNQYNFNYIFLNKGYVGNEGCTTSEVKKYIKKHHNEFDHIIMNGYSHLSEIKAIKFMSKNKIKFSLLINGGIAKAKENILKHKFKSSLISLASFYMSPSKASCEYLVHYSADRSRIFTYHYGNLDNNDFLNTSVNIDEIKQKYNLPTDKKLCINASQFIERKNNIELINFFKDRSDTLILVGDGPDKAKYESFIKENKISNVILLPYLSREDLFNLFKACDCFITLSKEDIFGQTTLEALANGLPVISSDQVMSSLEYISNNKNGYIVQLDNLENLPHYLECCYKMNKKDIVMSVRNNTFGQTAKDIYEILKNN